MRADLQRAGSRDAPPGRTGSALRRRPRVPGQPPARPRGAGSRVLLRRRAAASRPLVPAGRQRLGRRSGQRPWARACRHGGPQRPQRDTAGGAQRLARVDGGQRLLPPDARLRGGPWAPTASPPAPRVLGAAGAAACLITDDWEGIELFLEPEREVLVARDGAEVAAHVAALDPARARAIGEAALERVLAEHTYAQRAELVEDVLAVAA